jgi:flagellar biogenesis protein FliO
MIIEQEPQTNESHQQSSDNQDFQNMMKSQFEQMGTMLNLLTSVLTKLK